MPLRIRASLSFVFYRHVAPLVRLGQTKILESEDFPPLPDRLSPRSVKPAFFSLPTDTTTKFLFALMRAIPREVGLMALVLLIVGLAGLASPVLVGKLISHVALGADASLVTGIALALGLAFVTVVEGVGLQNFFYVAIGANQIVANALNTLIYRHSLRMTRAARLKTPLGDAVNHLGTDSDSVAEFPWIVVEATWAALMILAVTGLLFHYLGLAALSGVAVLVVMSPLTKRLAKRFTKLDDEIMKHRDERVSQISQMLAGIRIVKFFAWQDEILGEIEKVRGKEIEARRRLMKTDAGSLLIYVGANTFVCLAAFGTRLWMGGQLDAATVFPCLSLFAMLEHPFGNITRYISESVNARVSAGRILTYLKLPTLPLDERPVAPAGGAIGLELADVTARFDDAERDVLTNVRVSIPAGSSVAIVGPVGSGKTSMLLAALGELPITGGRVGFPGLPEGMAPRTAFVPQEAFVRNGTLRDNLLFGEPDLGLDAVVFATALEPDLARLPAGIKTEIGEHGVNLSGGQKQRVALARAAMARPGLILLDDPLSAVDHATETHLVDHLLFGVWKGSTRVVVTHRLEHLDRFDQVVFLENGAIVASGRYQELVAQEPRFAQFVAEHGATRGAGEALKDDGVAAASEAAPTGGEARITSEEDRERGAVKAHIYWEYIKALGGRSRQSRLTMLPLLFVATVALTVLPILQNTWLAQWTERVTTATQAEGWRNLYIFGALGLAALAVQGLQKLIWNLRAVAAGRHLHDDALRAVMGAPIRFFDSTPVGRVLNRFSRDVDAVERNLPWSFEHTVRATFVTAGATAVLVGALPITIVAIVPVIFLFIRLQRRYRVCAREAQRIFSVSRSPRFAHFKETLSGLAVIRGAHKGAYFTEGFYAVTAASQRDFHGLVLLNRWFSVRVPMIGAAVSIATATGVVLASQQGALPAGLAGLVLIYSLRFWESLNWGVRSFADAESKMTSVERLKNYGQIPQEPDIRTSVPSVTADEVWPTAGTITFDGVVARYAEHLPDVLKGVTFTIPGGSKAGLVGRTGSGKSTIFQALFRVMEIREGTIRIDGRDIAGVPLKRLRRAVAIIPQDPTLFRGKLRENLDRFGQHDDASLWQALERAHLKEFIAGLPNGLDADVKENGHNFSQGQRQLLCLARALLVDAKIIVMDEATASVDVETDALIQTTIRHACVDKTVLVIAHRLGTVEDADLVVDLEGGHVKRAFAPRSLERSKRSGNEALADRRKSLKGRVEEPVELSLSFS